ncbi:MAG: hypothetical protein EPO35_04060 [Acidobacteria bacterium]|nr:MAG: hypothetical protein EPO35_04060 [Acidobacteriota bacterium]
MRARWLILWWVGVAAAVWSGIYDILITRGTKEYFMREAMARAGDGPAASLDAIMRQTSHDAAITASAWAVFVAASGWATIWLAKRRSF